jgi:hypothetical protein
MAAASDRPAGRFRRAAAESGRTAGIGCWSASALCVAVLADFADDQILEFLTNPRSPGPHGATR